MAGLKVGIAFPDDGDRENPGENFRLIHGQHFCLLAKFSLGQEEEAKEFWRDLTDNRGKACVLLEERDGYSVWGKVRTREMLAEELGAEASPERILTQASILLLQWVYFEIEDELGTRLAGNFVKDISQVFEKELFPQAESSDATKQLLNIDPLSERLPPWQEHHIDSLLKELYRLGQKYFGNTEFVGATLEVLEDMPAAERDRVFNWLEQSDAGKLWKTV